MAADARRPAPDCDVGEIERALRLLIEPEQTFEIRALGSERGREVTWSGYFVDPAKAAAAIPAIQRNTIGVYVTLNPVRPELRARRPDRIGIAKKGETTGDQHIVRRTRLLFDIDAERPAGISSSDVEHKAAIDVAQELGYELSAMGWPEPLVADSGNGGHLVYGIDLPADDDGLVSRVLAKTAERWNCTVGGVALKVDTKVANASRISKLYGTLTRKGDNFEDRVHRPARIISAPERLETVPRELLEAYAGPKDAPPRREPKPAQGKGLPGIDGAAWLSRFGIEVKSTAPNKDGGTVYELAVCPFNGDHDRGEAFVIQRGSGALVAGCHHESCTWGWDDLREKFHPRAVRDAEREAERRRDPHPNAPPDLGGLPHGFTVVKGGRGRQGAAPEQQPEPEPGTWEHDLLVALEDVRKALRTEVRQVREPLFDDDILDILDEDFPETTWLVTGLITKGGVTMIGAEPKAAKTWIGTELAVAIATGTPVCGEFFAQRGRVAYFYAEDMKRHVRNRVRALLHGQGRVRPPRGAFKPQPRGKFLDITRDEDLAWVVASVRRKLGEVDVLILDPLRDLHSGEEDKSDSMRNVMRRLRLLSELLGCTVVVVHHSIKPSPESAKRRGGQRLRGSSAIYGAIDSGIYLSDIDVDEPGVIKNCIESELKGARGAGAFNLTLAIDDDDNGEAISARWEVERISKKEKREQEVHAKTDRLKAQIISLVRSRPEGIESKNAIHKVVGGNKKTLLALVEDMIGCELAYGGIGIVLNTGGTR